MAEKPSPKRPRRSSRRLRAEKPDDKIGGSSPVKHTIAPDQIDGHVDKRGSNPDPLKQTDEAKKGNKTAKPAKKKNNGKGVSGAVKKAAEPEKRKKAAKSKTGGQSCGEVKPEDVAGSSCTNVEVIGFPGRSGTANHRSGEQLEASLPVNVRSHGTIEPQESNQPGHANQPPDATHTSGQAQSGNQSSSDFASPIDDPSLATLNNANGGEWQFDTELPVLALPSYTSKLPTDQKEAMAHAACRANGLALGWLTVEQYRLQSGLENLTEQQALDLIEAVKKSQQVNPVKPQLNPSNEQAGIVTSQLQAPNPRIDVVFYQESIPEDDACADSADDDEGESETSDESFDISRYSLQTAEEGKWYDPKFELTGPCPSVKRLVAGENCPPNVLQQCDLSINPYGAPPRFIPHPPAIQRCSPQQDPKVVPTNVEGQSGSSRGDKVGRSHRTDSSQKRDNTAFFTHFGNFIAQSSQGHISQPDKAATCDCPDCNRELGEEYITCARCHQARYCRKFCQVYTWLVHLPTCNLHPESDAQQVTALEEWATELWNGAADAVKNAEKANAGEPMDIDSENSQMMNSEPHTSESSARTSSRTSDDVVMVDRDAGNQQVGTQATSAYHSATTNDSGILCDGAVNDQKDRNRSASDPQYRQSTTRFPAE